jgi:UDP-glucose 4-epimerase
VADPAFDARVNVLGTVNVALAAAAAGAGTLIFASTGGAIYGDTANVPTGEDEPPLPSSPYGAAKLAGEHYLRVLAQLHGFRWVALRYTNVYGPRQDPHGEAGVVAIFSERLLEGRETVIYGNGEQTRDYVYVGDVARANLLALESGVSGAYNVGTGSETTVNRLHSLIAGAAGSPEARAAHAPARPGEQSRSAVDASRAAQDLGWRPETDLAAGLQETVAFFRQRQVARV